MAANTNSRRAARVAKILATGAAAIGMGLLALSGPASSQTVTPGSTDQVQHFLDCFGVMISDPQVHAAECSPGHDWTGPFQQATGTEAAPPPPPSSSSEECPSIQDGDAACE
ncbi:MAG TPA: hypothetical protein VHA07_03520 [Devosia sp.]|nr:hypothetical protein [Devosia sp.]